MAERYVVKQEQAGAGGKGVDSAADVSVQSDFIRALYRIYREGGKVSG